MQQGARKLHGGSHAAPGHLAMQLRAAAQLAPAAFGDPHVEWQRKRRARF